MIKALIFDFDGVIIESIDIKTRGFIHVFRDRSPEIQAQVKALHLNNGGLSRYEKFQRIYRDILKEPLSSEKEKELAQEFQDFCYQEVLKCPFVPGAKEFLEKHYQRYKLFVVSGTPDTEIKNVVHGRQLDKYFMEVHGAPASKSSLVKMLLGKYRLSSSEAVFIGDAPNDHRGALDNQVTFIARINKQGYNPFTEDKYQLEYVIPDLSELSNVLARIESRISAGKVPLEHERS